MADERDNFELTGPRHLAHVHWADPTHRRCVAGSLVQGVYVLARDRQENRHGPNEALAPAWWTFFNFRPTEIMVDDVDGSIFGAVFEHAAEKPAQAPAAVVAFRGTILQPETWRADLKLDLVLISNGLHKAARFQSALRAVRSSVAKHGHGNVWIAGHSLGAAMALLAGRELCENDGFRVECHLFSPPFTSAPVEKIKNEKLKLGVHVAHSLLTAGLAVTVKGRKLDASDAFDRLGNWMPNLYVNPCDHICSGYVGYFGNRELMQGFGAGKIADIASRHSVNDCILSVFGKDSKPSHLIPAARLTVSLKPVTDFKRAHGIHQWWSPELQFRSTLFGFPTTKS